MQTVNFLKYICVQNLGLQVTCSHAVWQYSQSASNTPLTTRCNIHQTLKNMRLHCITLFPLRFTVGCAIVALHHCLWHSARSWHTSACVKRSGEGGGRQERGFRDAFLFLYLYSLSMVFLRRRAARVTITSISPSAPLLCVELDTRTSSSG